MRRDKTPVYVPHLRRRASGTYYVAVRVGPGEYRILSQDLPERYARRELRRVREAMFVVYDGRSSGGAA